MTRDDLIAFETGIKDLWESGELPCLLHLSGGNEGQLLNIFSEIKPGDWVFSTHRNHYHALLSGIPADDLDYKIRVGRSMFIYSKEHNFFCSAILAGTCAIAAGVAWAIREKLLVDRTASPLIDSESQASNHQPSTINHQLSHVWCFIGDGGEEQGHFYESAMFVESHNLPCTFIIEDNDRSVDTPKEPRRHDAPGLDQLFKCVRRYHYTPTYPHAGSGCKFQITFKPEAIERLKPK